MITIDTSDLYTQFESGVSQIKAVVKNGMRRAGEKYVATSRLSGSYKDHTGNLRNSNGYGIAENGVLTEVSANGKCVEKMKQQDLSGEMILECGAGEDYASHVQRKGFDVTDSGQLAAENEIRRLFK